MIPIHPQRIVVAAVLVGVFIPTTTIAYVPSSHTAPGGRTARWIPPSFPSVHLSSSQLNSNGREPDLERMKEIIQEESTDVAAMKMAAEQMKNLTPTDIDAMIRDMETMNPIQKQALKAMGADPDTMMQTMKLMRDNPQMMETAQKMMSRMTPEQLLEQSKQAQERLKGMTPEQILEANKNMGNIPKEILEEALQEIQSQGTSATTSTTITDVTAEDDDEDEVDDTDATPKEMATGPGTSSDPNVIAAMYKVAEMMSNDGETLAKGIGGVTLAGFASLPVIQMLSGTRDVDLSMAELKECWADGSLGATRVDQQGFERVWKEVQEYFEEDIMGEARKEAKNRVSTGKKQRRGSDKSSATSVSAASSPAAPKVGQSMSPQDMELANEMFKNMSDEQMSQMLEAMANPDPAQEARLKAMGADPNMLKQTAKLMNSNPMMRKAAKAMIKNMSGQDMLKMSQKAQEEMAKMTPEQRKAMMTPEMLKAMENMTPEQIEQAMASGGLSSEKK